MLPDTETRSPGTQSISTTSSKTAGSSSVRGVHARGGERALTYLAGNYDVSEMHYNGPTGVPNAGYGYELRVAGKSSANPPATTEEEQPVA